MDFNVHAINRDWSAQGKIDLLRQMMRIRRFEQAALTNYGFGNMGGWLILDIGQESVSTGVRCLMGPQDHSISGPRGLGHALAAGMDMGPCMAELFGKANGCSKGKGGMFSFYDPGRNHWAYRYYGFSVADANHKKYRTPEEIEERKARDPLARWRRHLQEERILGHDAAEEMDLAAKAEAKAAVAFAEAGLPPGIGHIMADVYWESDHDTPASRIGRHVFGE